MAVSRTGRTAWPVSALDCGWGSGEPKYLVLPTGSPVRYMERKLTLD